MVDNLTKTNGKMEKRKCVRCERYYQLSFFRSVISKVTGETIYQSYCKRCFYFCKLQYKQDILNNLPTERIPVQPHTYINEQQKKSTFDFLEKMGWELNIKTNRWYKNGLTDTDGNWIINKQTKN